MFLFFVIFFQSNVQDAYTQACANGAIPIQPPVTTENDMEYAVIGTPFGDWVHTLIHRPSSAAKQVFLPKYKQLNKPSSVKTCLEFIDHVAIAIENDTLPKLIAWYSAVLGFERFLSSDDDDSQSGVNIQSATTGLKTMVVAPAMYCNNSTTTTDTKEFKFVFVEPVSNTQNKSQIQEVCIFITFAYCASFWIIIRGPVLHILQYIPVTFLQLSILPRTRVSHSLMYRTHIMKCGKNDPNIVTSRKIGNFWSKNKFLSISTPTSIAIIRISKCATCCKHLQHHCKIDQPFIWNSFVAMVPTDLARVRYFSVVLKFRKYKKSVWCHWKAAKSKGKLLGKIKFFIQPNHRHWQQCSLFYHQWAYL